MQHETLVLIKQNQTVLRYQTLDNFIHAKKFTVLLKNVNPNIKFVVTTKKTMILNNLLEAVLGK